MARPTGILEPETSASGVGKRVSIQLSSRALALLVERIAVRISHPSVQRFSQMHCLLWVSCPLLLIKRAFSLQKPPGQGNYNLLP